MGSRVLPSRDSNPATLVLKPTKEEAIFFGEFGHAACAANHRKTNSYAAPSPPMPMALSRRVA
jgi:hypothetical protein